MINPIKIKRIYPKFQPTNFQRQIGSAILWGLLPIEPIIEILIIPVSISIEKRRLRKSSKDWIVFDEKQIIVSENEIKEVYQFNQIEALKIYYCKYDAILEKGESVDDQQFKNHLSRISFKSKEKQLEIFYNASRKEILKLCTALYDKGIKFKEYKNGQRVFKGKIPKYKEIQALKKQYNIEW